MYVILNNLWLNWVMNLKFLTMRVRRNHHNMKCWMKKIQMKWRGVDTMNRAFFSLIVLNGHLLIGRGFRTRVSNIFYDIIMCQFEAEWSCRNYMESEIVRLRCRRYRKHELFWKVQPAGQKSYHSRFSLSI